MLNLHLKKIYSDRAQQHPFPTIIRHLSIIPLKFKAYTLYELLFILSLIAVFMTLSQPILNTSLLNQSVTTTSSKIEWIIKFAKEEAIRRNTMLKLCAAEFNTSDNIHTYLNDCATDNTWNEGALLFLDLNSNSSYNSSERVSALRFDSNVSISLVTSPGATVVSSLYFSESGIIYDGLGSESWLFSLSKSHSGLTKSQQLRLNQYGFMCNVGESGC